MPWISQFCTFLSLVDWWPVRAPLLVITVGLLAALVWRFRSAAVRATLIPFLVLLLALNTLVGINAYFGYYPTIADALAIAGGGQGSLASLTKQKTPPPNGVVINTTIPTFSSHFQARPAQVYLPPAWFAHPRPRLPVVVLLHGTPGSPTDWLDAGQAAASADKQALSHGGVAPILVIPDINGDVWSDTECVDSSRGKAETYLTTDLPRFVRSQFQTRDPGKNWAVAGLSEGGSCAIMLALRHPGLFGAFADFGGLAGPRDGDVNAPQDTREALFGGSQQQFDQHEPAWLLTHRQFPKLHGLFVVGDADPEPLAATRKLAALSRAAGITTQSVIIPGGQHTFDVWRTAFLDALPWLSHVFSPTPPPPNLAGHH